MDRLLRTYFRYRQRQVEEVARDPMKYQIRVLRSILSRQARSEYGRKYGFSILRDHEAFKHALPLVRYEDIFPSIERMLDEEPGVLVTEKVRWFAKSSGTTNDRSKYIPVTRNYLVNGHLKCTWTTASVIYNEDPLAKLFADKNLIMAGSLSQRTNGIMEGDISAIMLNHFPKIGRRFSTPSFEVALIPDWEEKIYQVAKLASKERVTLIGGVPTWTIVLFKELLSQTGADNVSEIWPELRTYMHGGVGFEPYRNEFKKFLPSEKVIYREVYNATEGYFAIQNNKDEDGMLLLCDHQIFYEFIPRHLYGSENPDVITLQDVEKNKEYVLLITNSSGLYRYVIGDLIRFTSIAPFKIKVVGRTEQFINAFGEELMIANTDLAISQVCNTHNAILKDYSVCPRYMNDGHNGRHDWVVEFKKKPSSITSFAIELDAVLREINADYDAKRYKDLALSPLHLYELPFGTVDSWHKRHKKYGGQHKLPRLSNNRKIVEELLAMKPNFMPQ